MPLRRRSWALARMPVSGHGCSSALVRPWASLAAQPDNCSKAALTSVKRRSSNPPTTMATGACSNTAAKRCSASRSARGVSSGSGGMR